MSLTIVIMIVMVAVGVVALLLLWVGFSSDGAGRGNVSRNLRSMVAAQRQSGNESTPKGMAERQDLLFAMAGEQGPRKDVSSVLTLKRRLKYAQISMPQVAFHLFEFGISLFAFALVSLKFGIVLQIVSLLAGPIAMRWFLNNMVDRRFKKFDGDYAQFLLSLVGLLKTGMNPMGALEAASQGLEDGSLVRSECEMMMERLRFGVSEDKSIGAFGEDIYHPEIELFVQALLLSRRVGGGALSDTLERLSKQVRRRQYFRSSAVAAVGMQRGSIWVIIGMLVALQLYMYVMYPKLVVGGLEHPVGWQIWQAGIVVILLGIFWVRQVTKIKV